MAKKRNKTKKNKKKNIRVGDILLNMIITMFFLLLLEIGGEDKGAAFSIGTILLMLAKTPSTKLLNI